MSSITPHDLEKVRRCLDLLQRAQTIVNEAAQELCPVPGFADEWSALTKPHDAIKRAWHRVERRRAGLASRQQKSKRIGPHGAAVKFKRKIEGQFVARILQDDSKPSKCVNLRDLLAQYLLERNLSSKSSGQIGYTLKWVERFKGGPVFTTDLCDNFANRWLQHEMNRNPDQSPFTLKNRRRHLILLWRYAWDRELVDDLPRRVRKVVATLGIPRAWTQAEMQRLIGATASMTKRRRVSKVPRWLIWRALLMAAWDTALRPIDLKRLRPSDIGQDGTLHIIQHKTQWPIQCTLRPETLAAIAESKPETREFIFPGNHARWCEQMQRLTKAAGLVGSFKTIRKSSATAVESIQRGAAMSHLGHKTHGLAERHYIDPRLVQRDKVQAPSLAIAIVAAPVTEAAQMEGDVLAWL